MDPDISPAFSFRPVLFVTGELAPGPVTPPENNILDTFSSPSLKIQNLCQYIHFQKIHTYLGKPHWNENAVNDRTCDSVKSGMNTATKEAQSLLCTSAPCADQHCHTGGGFVSW